MKKQVILIHGSETFDAYEKYLTFLKGIAVSGPQNEELIAKKKEEVKELAKSFPIKGSYMAK